MYGGYPGEALPADYYGQRPPPAGGRLYSQQAPAPAMEDEYSERDLGEYAYSGSAPAATASRPPIHGRYSLPVEATGGAYDGYYAAVPPRSAYSSPPPRATSLEVGSVYGRESAPAGYSPSAHGGVYADPFAGGAGAGYAGSAAGGWEGGDVGAPANEHYWYQGPPPPANHYPARPHSVVSSSQTLANSRNGRRPSSHPASLYPASPDADSAPGFFGVDAAHHAPGRPRQSPYGQGQGGDNLPSFPAWSRTWYDGHMSANGHAYTTVPPAGSGWESETLTRSGASRQGGGPPYGRVYGRPGDHNMSDFVKEERMRMLEKEFGAPRTKHNKGDELEDDEEEEEVLGSVNSKGKLICERPKWVLAVRVLQGLFALAALACGVGGALLIKTGTTSPAARGTLAAYVLYAASIITILVFAYLFIFRPCCCDPMRKHIKSGGAQGAGGLGGLVIPVLSGGGGPSGKPPKGFKGKKGMQGGGGPTVNLIVDPALLGQGRSKGRKGDDESDDDSDDERLPGEARRKRRRRRRPDGLGVLGNMQLQARWRIARQGAKLFCVWDAILAVVWIAAAIVALGMGKKCPSGTAGGWCDFYNATIACGVILAVIQCAALWFDYRALKCSSQPPKPPI